MKLNQRFVGSVVIGLLLAICFFPPSPTAWAQSVPNPPTVLKHDRPITKSMAGKGRHIYVVRLSKGMFLELAVDQRDVDVTTEVFAPDSTSLGKFDAPTSERGIEHARIGADVTGDYRIEFLPRPNSRGRADTRSRSRRCVGRRSVTHAS